MCVRVLPVCVYMPLLHAYLGWPEEEEIRSHGARVTGSCGPSRGAETKLGCFAGTRLLNHQASLQLSLT